MTATDRFGCPDCFRAMPEVAAAARLAFVELARLIDESHFIVRILACPTCGQRCISIFTEMIDWSGGDDAQYWSLLPLCEEETAVFMAQGESVDIGMIESLGRDRRYLQINYPTGGSKTVAWRSGGLYIGPHD